VPKQQQHLIDGEVAEPRNDNERKHQNGECQPCAFYAFKSFACSKGDDCEFCHLCTKSQAKMRKRAKAKVIQKEVAELALASKIRLTTKDGYATDDDFD